MSRWSKILKQVSIISAITDFVFHQDCVLCGSGEDLVCGDCLRSLPKAQAKCLKCGKRNPFSRYCDKCKKPYHPDLVLGAFKYSQKMKKLVALLKFEDVSFVAKRLAPTMAAMVKGHISNCAIVPIPLSSKRAAYRGYNQSDLLAREIAKEIGCRVEYALSRRTSEFSQVEVKGKKLRRENVKNAFEFILSSAPKEVLLVDDVITTGATVEEASKTLKKAGVKRTVVCALAMGK